MGQQELESVHQAEHAFDGEAVRQMLMLAERLREVHGGELDDAAIQAVSEACQVPVEYVRVAITRLPENKKQGPFSRVRSAVLTLEPDVRQYVMSSVLATNFALLGALENRTGDQYGVLLMLELIMIALGIWNVSLAKDTKTAAFSGAIFGGLSFATFAIFSLILQSNAFISGAVLIPVTFAGALIGILANRIVGRFRSRLGIKDPLEERQELLRQLHDLQSKLRTGEQSMTFLSLDVVGSTKMKEQADPLSIEFTFNEYHKFVEAVVRKHGGRVHSTAGDGVTCAFEHPQHAFAAARNIQAGIIELNTFRNRIGTPLVLRAGVHMGTVVVPPGQDITKINFAHVIDVAAHIQKVCPPGGIAVSDAAAAHLMPGSVSQESVVEAQDVKARVWQPRLAPNPLPAQTPAAPTFSTDQGAV